MPRLLLLSHALPTNPRPPRPLPLARRAPRAPQAARSTRTRAVPLPVVLLVPLPAWASSLASFDGRRALSPPGLAKTRTRPLRAIIENSEAMDALRWDVSYSAHLLSFERGLSLLCF